MFKTALEWCYLENKEQLGSGENEEAGEPVACSYRRILVDFLQWLEFRFRSFNQARNKPESWRNQHILELKNAVIPVLLAIKNVDSQGKQSGIQGGLIGSGKKRKQWRSSSVQNNIVENSADILSQPKKWERKEMGSLF